MKLNVSKKNVLILILVFSMIFCISGLCGYLLWKNNLSIGIDGDMTYAIGNADLTTFVQYSELTETFLLSFIFTCYGLGVGFIINTFILLCYIIIRLIIDNQGYSEYRKEYKRKKYEYKTQKLDEKHEKKTKETRKEDVETEAEDGKEIKENIKNNKKKGK